MIYCHSCGSALKVQLFSINNKNQFNLKNDNYCWRCFRIKHYQKLSTFSNKNVNYDRLFKNINHQNGVIFYLISIIDFFGSLIPQYHKYLRGLQFYIVITKIDAITQYRSDTNIKIWVNNQLKLLKLTPIAIFLVSSAENHLLTDLIIYLQQWKTDIYWIGKKNVGKKSLIIKLLMLQECYSRKLPVTSYFLNSKVEVILIPYKEYLYFYDIPSFSNFNQINFNLSLDADFKLNLINKIKVQTYHLNPQQAITIVGLWQFLFEEGLPTSFKFYGSNKLILHLSSAQNRLRIWDQQILLLKEDTKIIEHIIKITKGNEDQIAIQIYGYGWLTFKARKQILRLRLPKNCGYKIINPLI